MKKLVLIISCIAFISCNNSEKEQVAPEINTLITGAISHEILKKEIACDPSTSSFSIPNFNSNTEADRVLNHAITGLITKDFTDITYQQGASLKSTFETFSNRRERVLCEEHKNEGLIDIKTIFVSDNSKFTSYELDYSRAKEKGRLLKTFLKPEMKEIYLNDIIPENKKADVKTIFDVNLQQAVANLVTEIPAGGDLQNQFVDYVKNTAFKFDVDDFKTAGLAFQFNNEISKNLRLSKKVSLPKEFDFLNNTVVIEIDAHQLNHYLDLSRIIN